VITSSWQTVDSKTAAKELIELNKRLVKNEAVSFKVAYISYKEHLETKPYETIKGSVIKEGKNVYSKINGALTIQNEYVRVVVDSAKRSIKLTDPLSGPEPQYDVSEFAKVINMYKAVKRKEETKTIAYRFEPKTDKGIIAQEIYVGEDFLSKTVTFYINEHTIRQNNELIKEIVFPRLEICISDFKKLPEVNASIFSEKAILKIEKDKVILQDRYKTFKFFDGRYKK
jgi:hypothetical protein